MGRLIKLLLISFIISLFVKCNENIKLDKELLYTTRQNIFFKNFIVSLIVTDKWREDCYLFLFNKNGDLIDKINCPSDPLPTISYLNDSTLLLTYDVSKNDSSIKKTLTVSPIILQGIKVATKVKYDYEGNASGITFFYKKVKINKDKNLVTFFLNNKETIVLSTGNIFTDYGKIKFRENKNGIFINYYLKKNNSKFNDYYEEFLSSIY